MKLPRARALKIGGAELAARQIAPFVRWSIRLGTMRAQVAWLLAAVGLVICLAVFPRITGYPHYTQHTTAVVVDSDGADAIYEYGDQNHKSHTGHAPLHESAHLGATIDIWYDPANPGHSSVIERYESDHPGPGSYALIAWPGLAILLACFFMWRPRMMRLLRHGRPTSIKPRKSGDPFVITFDYVTDDGKQKTNTIPALRTYTEPEKLVLFYAPWNPYFAVVLDELPTRPRLDGERFVATRRPLGLFLLPLLTFAAAAALVVACIR